MRTYFVFACFVLAAIGLAWGEPWGQPTLLYKTAGPHGKYVLVLSRTYTGGVKTSISDVIMSDSFVVRRDDSDYEVILTNAVRFHSESLVVSSPSGWTNFVQGTISNSVLYIGFPTNTQVLFDGSMTDLGHIQLGGVSGTNKVEYQGDATMPNKSASGKGGIPVLLHAGRPWPALPELDR
jgi:hypothetical protein